MWRKIRLFGAGFIIFKMINFVFFGVIAPVLVWAFHMPTSIILLSFLSFFRGKILIELYDRAQKDWFQIETSKKIIDKKIFKLFLFIIFLIWEPVIMILFFRKGSGIPKRLRIIFAISITLSTIFCVLIWSEVLILIKNYFN
jgi:hypothetical protein